MFFIEIENGLIISKTKYDGVINPDGYVEITQSLYDSIGAIPCSFTETGGEITGIEYIEPTPEPTPEPTEIEVLQDKVVDIEVTQTGIIDTLAIITGVTL